MLVERPDTVFPETAAVPCVVVVDGIQAERVPASAGAATRIAARATFARPLSVCAPVCNSPARNPREPTGLLADRLVNQDVDAGRRLYEPRAVRSVA